MIGMDLEWKGDFIDSSNHTPAIMQIFSHEGGIV